MNPSVAGAALVFGLGFLAVASGRVPRERAVATLVLAAALALALLRQLALALPLALLGFSLWSRGGGLGASGRSRAPSPGQTSEISTDALLMRLDHDTGELDGEILTGPRAGQLLSTLTDAALLDHARALQEAGDTESLSLLSAYLERRGIDPSMAESGAGDDPAGMSEAEALGILGLAPGASQEEVRAAYRRLMKRVHPDLGGSDALAAVINRAKARLDPD